MFSLVNTPPRDENSGSARGNKYGREREDRRATSKFNLHTFYRFAGAASPGLNYRCDCGKLKEMEMQNTYVNARCKI